MSNTSASLTSSGLHYPSHFYNATARWNPEGIFPFQMHPITFPFENYHLPTPYYPHLAESLNLKLTQSIYRPTLNSSTSTYDHEIGKIFTNNLLSRVPNVNINGGACKEEEVEGGDKNAKENEVTSSEEIPSSDLLRLKSTQTLYDAASKILFLAIRWAKSIPSFSQLPMLEQKKLLSESWSELFVIAAAQWGLSIEDEMVENLQYLKQLQAFIKHFVQMKVDHFEAACLKALILFRAGIIEDQMSSQQISMLQNQTLCLLIEKCGGLRLGHLMLLLPQIKAIGNAQNLQVRLFFIRTGLRIFLCEIFAKRVVRVKECKHFLIILFSFCRIISSSTRLAKFLSKKC